MVYAKATVSGRTIAESDDCQVVEGNYYFPPNSVDQKYLSKSSHTTHCGWKGDASYYNIILDKTELNNAAWYYPDVISDKAKPIKDFVAFYKTMVQVEGK